MAKYVVRLKTMAEVSVRVEAEDGEAAIEAAYEGELPWLCAQCSGWGRKYSMDLGEWEPADQEIHSEGYPAAELDER